MKVYASTVIGTKQTQKVLSGLQLTLYEWQTQLSHSFYYLVREFIIKLTLKQVVYQIIVSEI